MQIYEFVLNLHTLKPKTMKTTKVIWLSFILSILSFCPGKSNAVDVMTFHTDVLTSHLFSDIVQDSKGYIWIATEYGLNKYDGSHFTHYYATGQEGALSNNSVRRLGIDNAGNLFVLCDNRIQRYDSTGDRFLDILDDEGNTVRAADIAIKDNTILVVNDDSEIFNYENGKLTKRTNLTESIKRPIDARRIFIDSKNSIWLGTLGNGLYRIDSEGKRVRHFYSPELNGESVNSIVSTADGTIYIASSTKLWRYNSSDESLHAISHDEAFSSIRDLIVTSNDIPLIGTYGRGLYYYDKSTDSCLPLSRLMNTSQSLSTGNVTTLYQDNYNNLWTGCFNEGLVLSVRNPSVFTAIDISTLKGGNFRPVTMIYNTRDGYVWVGQEQNGLFKLDSKGKVTGHYLDGFTPLSMAEDTDGMLHVGLYDRGVAIFNPSTGSFSLDDRIGYTRVKNIVSTDDGSMWYSIFNRGITRRTRDNRLIQLCDSISKFINCMFIDSDSILWAGHYDGVSCIDPGTHCLVESPVDSLLSTRVCYAIAERRGTMYFGTSTGLYSYDKDTKALKRYTTADGLSNDVICGIAEDHTGNVWLSTFKGLTRFDPENEHFVPYFSGNGLKDTNYARSVYSTDSDGNIFFANDHSLIGVNPSELDSSRTINGVVLTRMIIHHNKYEHTADSNYHSDRPIDEVHRFTLSHNQDVFSMYFATHNYSDSKNQQLQYRLNDNDRWLTTDPGDMKIQFTRLPAGTWDLQVRALNNGVTSAVSHYEIRILPPWYASWWAIMLYILFLIGIAVFIFRLWMRHQLDLNNEAKLRFFIDLAHEFRSPITLMLAPLDKLLKSKSDDPEATRALRNIDRNANRMMQLLNQILDIRRIDKGQMKIQCTRTDIVAFTREVCEMFDYEAEKRKCHINFTSTNPTLYAWIDPDHFDKIIYNLLSNAFKYIKDGGTIDVSVMPDPTPRAGFPEGSVRISVTDSGPGIKEDEIKKIFERFYQITPRSKEGARGYGLGLNLSRQLVELHHGTIEVENRTDDPTGARFIVNLPLGCRHLSANQISSSTVSRIEEKASKRRAPISADDDNKSKYTRKRTNYHILIVDDDEELRSYLASELRPIYHVKECGGGEDALKEIVAQQPDLIISDIKMPDMDGYELLHRIKTNSRTNTIPVILLTSSPDTDERIKGLQKGADAYLNKPFNLEELLARISGLIANRKLIKGKFSGAQDQAELVEAVSVKDPDDQLMKNIMTVLNDNVDNPSLNVEMLSNEVGMSRAQLHRRIKDITGISSGEFIRNFRLNHAAQLLTQGGNIYVTQVAYACGFSNPTNFSTTFKKHFSMTPSEYIDAKRKPEA